MAIPVAVGGRPCPQIAPTPVWKRFWRGFLNVLGLHPKPDPLPEPAATVPDPTAVAGDACPAFSDLFAHYHPVLLDYLYGMTRDRELAADLAQDTFERAFAASPDLVGIAQPRAWLYRIATHVALNAIRRGRHFEWLPLSRVAPEGDEEAARAWSALPPVEVPQAPGNLAADVAEHDAVWTVLAELPPRWRAVLLLQTVAGFEVREVAVLLQLSEANVRKSLFRAKERFRALYRSLDRKGDER
jgi:RNA polymerase sigma-70 factor (ECF subfamily)